MPYATKTHKRVWFCDRDCDVYLAPYRDGGATAIQLIDRETAEPVATASVNIPEAAPPTGFTWIKTWSENEGILEALIDAGVVQDMCVRRACGFAEAALVRLLV